MSHTLFTHSRSTGNLCAFQSLILLPWTYILPVVMKTVIATDTSSSEVGVISTK